MDPLCPSQKGGKTRAHRHLWFSVLPTQYGGRLETNGIFTLPAQCHHPHHRCPIRVGLPPPTFIPEIARLAKYLAYISGPEAPPLVARAVMVQKANSSSSKFGWWNNSWRLFKDLHITPDNIGSVTLADLKDDLQGHYRRWWLQQFSDPNAHPKLCTFRLQKVVCSIRISQRGSWLFPPHCSSLSVFQSKIGYRVRSPQRRS